jgi:hypothetical protein
MKNKLIRKLCDFGLWILSFPPKDSEDLEWEQKLIEKRNLAK